MGLFLSQVIEKRRQTARQKQMHTGRYRLWCVLHKSRSLFSSVDKLGHMLFLFVCLPAHCTRFKGIRLSQKNLGPEIGWGHIAPHTVTLLSESWLWTLGNSWQQSTMTPLLGFKIPVMVLPSHQTHAEWSLLDSAWFTSHRRRQQPCCHGQSKPTHAAVRARDRAKGTAKHRRPNTA